MAIKTAQILHFENNAITEINYIETPHYQLTKAFMDNPERYLREWKGEFAICKSRIPKNSLPKQPFKYFLILTVNIPT